MGKGRSSVTRSVGGTVGGFFGDLTGANAAADAAHGAAMAQMNEAQRQRAELRRMTEGVTVEGLHQYDQALKLQEKNIARQEQLLASIDPTILEASQQALRLLRGETSSTLQPFQNQRAQQRQKLVDSLRQQLGPGAETSSAGRQALMRFDSESSQLFAGAQQQALGNLGALGAQFSSFRPDLQGSALGLGQLASNRAGLRFTQAGLMQGANQNVLQSAGAQFTGDLLRAQNQGAVMSNLIKGGMTAGTLYAMSGSGAAAAGSGSTMTTPGTMAGQNSRTYENIA